MRRVLPGDVSAAACVLLALPQAQRKAVMALMVGEADAADAYRQRTGQLHPHWGDGSLMSAALARSHVREPFLDDPDYAACMLLVFRAFLDRAFVTG